MIRRVLFGALSIALLAAPADRYFEIAHHDGVDWLRAPDGELMFSNGVNVVDERRALERLRGWGFNTLGAWTETGLETSGWPFTVELHIGSSLGFPWCDLFADEFAAGVRKAAHEACARYRGNTRLIGYFPDNELGWWGQAIFLYHLAQPPTSVTRQRLFAVLREHYLGDFTRLQQDFEAPGAKSWGDLESAATPRLWLRPGRYGMSAISQFTEAVAERYYELVCTALRQSDPGRLVLGDRYASYYDDAVVRAASRRLDVVSTNYSADYRDGSLSRYFLDALHHITGKPLIVTEYYFCARQNSSGNSNRGEIFPVVETQAQRAAAFARNLTELTGRPYVLGAHWFQYRDEPKGGRKSDGEDYNMGLVDTAGRPYDGLVKAASRLNTTSLHRTAAAVARGTNGDLPLAPTNPWAGLAGWPRDRAFVPPLVPAAPADLYICRSREAFWLSVTFMDYADPKLYRDAAEFARDLPWLKIETAAGPPIVVEALAGNKARVSQTGLRATFVQRGTRSTFIVQLPAAKVLHCDLRGTGGGWRAEWKTP